MAKVVVEGWQDPRNPKPLSLVDLIRRHAGLDLPAAKKVLDELTENGQVAVPFADALSARGFAREVHELGAIVKTVEE